MVNDLLVAALYLYSTFPIRSLIITSACSLTTAFTRIVQKSWHGLGYTLISCSCLSKLFIFNGCVVTRRIRLLAASPMYTSPELLTATPSGASNFARRGGPLSP